MNVRGMTLIELVVVILILGALVAAATMSGFDAEQTGFSVKGEAQKLASNIRYIQLQAMTQEEPLRININSNSYTLTDLSGNAENRSVLRGNSVSFDNISLTTDLPNDCLTFDSAGEAHTSCSDTSTALSNDRTVTLTEGSHSNTVDIAAHAGTAWLS